MSVQQQQQPPACVVGGGGAGGSGRANASFSGSLPGFPAQTEGGVVVVGSADDSFPPLPDHFPEPYVDPNSSLPPPPSPAPVSPSSAGSRTSATLEEGATLVYCAPNVNKSTVNNNNNNGVDNSGVGVGYGVKPSTSGVDTGVSVSGVGGYGRGANGSAADPRHNYPGDSSSFYEAKEGVRRITDKYAAPETLMRNGSVISTNTAANVVTGTTTTTANLTSTTNLPNRFTYGSATVNAAANSSVQHQQRPGIPYPSSSTTSSPHFSYPSSSGPSPAPHSTSSLVYPASSSVNGVRAGYSHDAVIPSPLIANLPASTAVSSSSSSYPSSSPSSSVVLPTQHSPASGVLSAQHSPASGVLSAQHSPAYGVLPAHHSPAPSVVGAGMNGGGEHAVEMRAKHHHAAVNPSSGGGPAATSGGVVEHNKHPSKMSSSMSAEFKQSLNHKLSIKQHPGVPSSLLASSSSTSSSSSHVETSQQQQFHSAISSSSSSPSSSLATHVVVSQHHQSVTSSSSSVSTGHVVTSPQNHVTGHVNGQSHVTGLISDGGEQGQRAPSPGHPMSGHSGGSGLGGGLVREGGGGIRASPLTVPIPAFSDASSDVSDPCPSPVSPALTLDSARFSSSSVFGSGVGVVGGGGGGRGCLQSVGGLSLGSVSVGSVGSTGVAEGVTDTDVQQVEMFYKSHKTEVTVCRCLANLYIGAGSTTAATTPSAPSTSKNSNNNKKTKQKDSKSTPPTTNGTSSGDGGEGGGGGVEAVSESQSWEFITTGIPVLVLDSGDHLRPRQLSIVIAEKGTGFSLWKDVVSHLTRYSIPHANFHTLSVSTDTRKLGGLSFDDSKAAAEFAATVVRLTADPDDDLLMLSKKGKGKKKKSIKGSSDKKKTKYKPPKKTDISQPCCFQHVTKLERPQIVIGGTLPLPPGSYPPAPSGSVGSVSSLGDNFHDRLSIRARSQSSELSDGGSSAGTGLSSER